MSEARTHAISTVLRPDPRLLWTRFGHAIILPVALLVIYGIGLATSYDAWERAGRIEMLILLTALIVGGVIVTALRTHNQQIEYSSTQFAVRDLLRRRRVIELNRIQHAIVVWTPAARRRERASLFVVDVQGQRFAHIDSEKWPIGRLATLAAELVGQPGESTSPADLADVRELLPHAIPWSILHPNLHTAVWIAATLAGIGICAATTTLVSNLL